MKSEGTERIADFDAAVIAQTRSSVSWLLLFHKSRSLDSKIQIRDWCREAAQWCWLSFAKQLVIRSRVLYRTILIFLLSMMELARESRVPSISNRLHFSRKLSLYSDLAANKVLRFAQRCPLRALLVLSVPQIR